MVSKKAQKGPADAKPAVPAKAETPSFAFADVDDTWARRAADAGLSYKHQLSERSGLKVVPELEVFTNHGVELKPQAQDGAAAIPAVVQPQAAAPMAFGPSDSPMFKTAMNDFMEQEKERAKKQPPPSALSRYPASYGMPPTIRYTPPPSSRLALAVKLGLGLLLLGGLGFGALAFDKHYHLSEILAKLKNGTPGNGKVISGHH